MTLTDKDMHELHEAHRDLFLPVVETARMRAMLTDAAARSAVNAKLEQQRKHHDETQRRRDQRELFMREMGADMQRAVHAWERELLTRASRNQCVECGVREGERHSLTCSAVNTAEQPEMMWRCVCGQEMRVERWQAHGCGLCGRKPVGHPEHPAPEPNAALTIEQWQRGDLSAAWAEPELTPAERTWRAHKGFSR